MPRGNPHEPQADPDNALKFFHNFEYLARC
jgi:hypothetical protein